MTDHPSQRDNSVYHMAIVVDDVNPGCTAPVLEGTIMLLKRGFIPGVLLIAMPLMAMAATPPGWKITQPHPDNPSKTATLAGTAQFGNYQSPATLTVTCRPDAGMPTATLRVEKTVASRFPVSDFEGPGGIGEKARLVQIHIARQNLTRSYNSTGSRQENDSFEWTFEPQKSEFNRWLKATDKTMTVNVVKPAKQGTTLQARFLLPADNKQLADLISPCLTAKTRTKQQ